MFPKAFFLKVFNPFPKRQILDFSELKEFADDNFKFVKKGRKLSKSSFWAIFLFPKVFSKDLYYGHIKIRACLGKG